MSATNPRGPSRPAELDIVILGLSITSSWGNGHATTYRALCRALDARGHRVRFLERDVRWYAANRDLPAPAFAETHVYQDLDELRDRYAGLIRDADIVIVGLDSLHQTPRYNVYSHLVYATKASDVRTVVIEGRVVMRERRLLTLNETLIKQKANLLRERVTKSLR